MRVPASTYRLQITADFDLDAAAGVLDYVTDLGADWIYLSPLLSAEPGSDHGYDVVDHGTIDPARGGPDALARLAAAAQKAGRGILIDIVPNHMGVATPRQNAWWWDLLKHGQGSRYAEAFDVDWTVGNGTIRLPVLGDDSTGESELDRLEIVGDELRYYDNAYPLAPGTADDGASARVVHARQHYTLMGWRLADTDLNYRRFFGINSLAGIRVEVPWVFAESHVEIIRWMKDGLAQGLRVDHPDGLADPGGYLDLLREATQSVDPDEHEGTGESHDPYVLVEKILTGREQLPTSWSTAGTSGYDALADFDRVLVDPAGQAPLDRLEARLHDPAATTLSPGSWADMVHADKRAVADGMLHSEVLRLARLVVSSGSVNPGTESVDADAIAELLACFPVYRSYLPLGAEQLQLAARRAREYRPDLSAALERLLPLLGDHRHPAAVRFQQTSGMVMAKGVEDNAYYRFSRLTALNEVGADPDEFAVDVAEFHRRQQLRQACLPASMTTLSTHDTKRGEDVRARIAVLAEIPGDWQATLEQLRAAAPLNDAPYENLLWQAIVGAWPASRERLLDYALKAAREAGTSTQWTETNEPFERALRELIVGLDDGITGALVDDFVTRVRQAGWSNSLAAKLMQLTAPGVPDVYQGSELWETSLVDPDNRRPVDYAARRAILENIDDGWLPPIDQTGAAKMLITSEALRLRRDEPERFVRYAPVAAFGAAAAHVIAYERGAAITVATRLPLGLAAAGGWKDTCIMLAGREYLDVLTGSRVTGGATSVAELLERYPVALLIPNDLPRDEPETAEADDSDQPDDSDDSDDPEFNTPGDSGATPKESS